jgi:nitroreductase
MALMLLGATMTKAATDGDGNEALNCIMTRTSIRQYQDRPVEQEKVEQLLRAAMAAPTAVNKQPWHFYVLNTKEAINRLADASQRGSDMVRSAALVVVVCGDMDKALEGKAREYWIQDTSAATENMLLAAHALGLGAVWTGVYPMKERVEMTTKVLNLPENLVPLCAILIGYPAESPTPKDKWKPENVTYIDN